MAVVANFWNTQHCAVNSCQNSRTNSNLSFFRFPKNLERCKEWVNKCQRQDLIHRVANLYSSSLVVCSEHFRDECFYNVAQRKRLTKNAIPKIFNNTFKDTELENDSSIVDNPQVESGVILTDNTIQININYAEQEIDNPSAEHIICAIAETPAITSISSTISASVEESLKRKLKKCRLLLKTQHNRNQTLTKKLERLNKKLLQNPIEAYFPELPVKGKLFLDMQLRIGKKRAKGRRFTMEDKQTCLALYYQGPKVYAQLRKMFFLPACKTLSLWLQQVPCSPGLQKEIINILRLKVQTLTEEEKLTVLTFDEMALKECLQYNSTSDNLEGFVDLGKEREPQNVNHAAVFMLSGVTHYWRQPLSYYFVKDSMKKDALYEILIDTIETLINIGFILKVVIADHAANNRAVFSRLNITKETPYAIFKQQKVFFMSNPPHLLKSLRNMLMKYDFVVDKERVSWKYIKRFQEKDSEESFRLAPKLTRKHLNPTQFQKMNVKLASQVFSHSVSMGMYFYVMSDRLGEEHLATMNFIKEIDTLFDIFNSSNLKVAKSKTSANLNFLEEKFEWFGKIEVIDCKRQPLCLKGWQIAISALLKLCEDLVLNHGLKFLITSNLNQDGLENFFSEVRLLCGCKDNPTLKQFRSSLRKLLSSSLF